MEKVGIAIGLVAGVVIGYNWPKIKKAIEPFAEALANQVAGVVTLGLRNVVEMKERFEDRRAETRARREAAQAKSPQGVDGTQVQSAV
jgi:hypothetical protein